MGPAPESAKTGGLSLAILAAGASRRLGSCKALVNLGGDQHSCPLARLLRAGQALQPETTMVISGRHHAEIRALHRELESDAILLHNTDWEAGRSGGVRLAHLQAPAHDLCLAPVDVPLVPARLFSDLAEAWRLAGSPAMGWLAPALSSGERWRHGHPVILGRALLAQLSEDCSDLPLRRLRELAEPVWRLPTEEASILDNLDDAAALERLRALVEAGTRGT